jgi:hypothetical protein
VTAFPSASFVACRPSGRVGAQCLHDPLRHEKNRENDGQRQKDVEGGSRQIDPEVSECRRALSGDAADKRDITAMPEAAQTKFCTASPVICVR